MNAFWLMLGGITALVLLVFGILFMKYANLWLRAYVSRAKINPFTLIFMPLKKVNPHIIVDARIMAIQAGLEDVTTSGLEAHFMAGGNVRRCVQALIAAARAKIELDWNIAAAIDLAGRNVLEAVQTSVNPKVIDCPD